MEKAVGFVLLILVAVTTETKFREDGKRVSQHGTSSYDYSAAGESGPEYWKLMFPEYCAGFYQSPVNLQNPEPMTCEPFEFSGYDALPDHMVIKNNGHTAKVAIKMDPMPTVSGGCLNGTYEFLQFHWHWGSSNEEGSEHQINGAPYSMELHLVHWNTKYESATVAMNQPDGLAVLGIMVKEYLRLRDRSPYDTIAKSLKHIRQFEQSTPMTPIALVDLLPDDITSYYRYSGSLTTPTCNEVVTWTVFEDTVKISKQDIYEFRQLNDGDEESLYNNFRPVQPLNGRTIYLINQ